MSLFAWITLGLLAGVMASKLVNRTGEGFFLDILLGIVGAISGGLLFSALGASSVATLNSNSLLVAVVGSVLFPMVYHAVFRRSI